jgi:predicted HD phosphohydrolase
MVKPMSHQQLPESHERLLLSMFGTKEEKERYERIKNAEAFMLRAFDAKEKEHKHRLKVMAFDEETGIGRWACKCGHEVERKAQFMCSVEDA